MSREELLQLIDVYWNENGLQNITGPIGNSVLKDIVNSLFNICEGATSAFKGLAIATTNPGTPAAGSFWLAKWDGLNNQTYTHFGKKVIAQGELAFLLFDGTNWGKQSIAIITAESLKYNPDATSPAGSMAFYIKSLWTRSEFMGVATPAINPGNHNRKVHYLAGMAGYYRYFGNISLNGSELAVLEWNGGAWTKSIISTLAAGGNNFDAQNIRKILRKESKPTKAIEMHLEPGATDITFHFEAGLGDTSGSFIVISKTGTRLGSKSFNSAQKKFLTVPIDPASQVATGINGQSASDALPTVMVNPALDVILCYTSDKDIVLNQIVTRYKSGYSDNSDLSIAAANQFDYTSIPSDERIFYAVWNKTDKYWRHSNCLTESQMYSTQVEEPLSMHIEWDSRLRIVPSSLTEFGYPGDKKWNLTYLYQCVGEYRWLKFRHGDITIPAEPGGSNEVNWNTILELPTSFPPSLHSHSIEDVAQLQDNLDALNQKTSENEAQINSLHEAVENTAPASHGHSVDDISGLREAISQEVPGGGTGGPVAWNDITGKPAAFPPENHVHGISNITGLQMALDAKASTTELANSISILKGGVPADGDTLAKLRNLISGIQTLLNSNNVNLDSLQEIVDYITTHQSLLDGVSINKVNISDIVDDLFSEAVNKPLSANQGRIIKQLIDQKAAATHTHSPEEVGAMPATTGGSPGQVMTKTETGQEWQTPQAGSGSVSWDNLEGKPADFPPSAHGHTPDEVGALASAPGGSIGQALIKTQSGHEWQSIPKQTSYTFVKNPNDTTSLDTALRTAITAASSGDVLDLTDWKGNHALSDTIIINKSITLIFGNINLSFNSTARDKDMFKITVDSVSILGYGRSPNPSTPTAPTKLTMTGAGGGYHIRSRGASSLTFRNFDLHGLRSVFNEREGTFTGVGGMFLEKADPDTISSGNTVNNLIIDSVFINNTIGHGIYIDTPIIAKISNTRVSGAGRHGVYIKGGTSIVIDATYVASSHLAGFCFDGVSYAAFSASAAENSGIGYWFRSCNAINLYGCGAEWLINKGSGDTLFGISNNNSGIKNGNGTVIDDCSSTFRDAFRGVGYMVTGGRNINLFSPYSINVGMIGEAGASSVFSCHIWARSAVRGLNIFLPRTSRSTNLGAENTPPNRFDIRIQTDGAEKPRDVTINYNPEQDGTVVPGTGKPFITSTNADADKCPIFNEGENTRIYHGSTQYNNSVFRGNIRCKETILTCAPSIAWSAGNGNIFQLTVNQTCHLENPSNLQPFATYQIMIKQDTTGFRTMTFGNSFLFPNGVVPSLSLDPNAMDILTGISDGTYLYVTMVQNFMNNT